jgi:hypothetical protein
MTSWTQHPEGRRSPGPSRKRCSQSALRIGDQERRASHDRQEAQPDANAHVGGRLRRASEGD